MNAPSAENHYTIRADAPTLLAARDSSGVLMGTATRCRYACPPLMGSRNGKSWLLGWVRNPMSDKGYKAFERRVAKTLNGKRNPSTGEQAQADVESDIIVAQCKLGYRMPGYLLKWLEGMVKWRDEHAKEKVACVVWKRKYHDDKDALVVLRLEDFQQIVNNKEKSDV